MKRRTRFNQRRKGVKKREVCSADIRSVDPKNISAIQRKTGSRPYRTYGRGDSKAKPGCLSVETGEKPPDPRPQFFKMRSAPIELAALIATAKGFVIDFCERFQSLDDFRF